MGKYKNIAGCKKYVSYKLVTVIAFLNVHKIFLSNIRGIIYIHNISTLFEFIAFSVIVKNDKSTI